MTDPTPYVPEEGAGIYRLCDVPEGWEWRRYAAGAKWIERGSTPIFGCETGALVEARPPRPVMVEVSADEVIERLGYDNDPRMAKLAIQFPCGQRLLDAAWAAKDAAGVGASKSAVIVEARPPRPVMVEVSADEVIEALGVRPLGRDPLLGATEGGDARQRLLDAAWAAKDAAS